MVTALWLILFVIFLIIELCTMMLTTVWFAGGAAVAFILSLAGLPFIIQAVTFVVTSLVLLIFTRPFAVKYVNSRTVKTNADRVIGKEAKVTERIDNLAQTGTVSVQGLEWTARAEDNDETFEKGSVVKVRSIKGVSLIVSGKQKEEE